MDRQVCASYICFVIYLVAHRESQNFPAPSGRCRQRSRAAIKPKRKLFYLMTLSALASSSAESTGGETDRDASLAGRFLSNVPHNAIDRCPTGAGQEQHQRARQ
jgi:hypothetical protein